MVNFLHCKIQVKGKDIFGPCTWALLLQKCLAEILGTALLVFLGCMGAGVGTMMPNLLPYQYVIATFNFGLAVMIPILAVGHISGCHINPAVSVCLCIMKHFPWPMLPIYVIMQCIGGVLGYGLLWGLTPSYQGKKICVTELHAELGPLRGIAFEGIATAILCFVICGMSDKRNSQHTDAPAMKVGLTVSSLALVEAAWTGTSLNPARSLGPAVWTQEWTNQYVYWIGPVLGAAFTGVFYRLLLDNRGAEDELNYLTTEEKTQNVEDKEKTRI